MDSGAFTAQNASFTNMDESGIQLSGSGPFAINHSTFDWQGSGLQAAWINRESAVDVTPADCKRGPSGFFPDVGKRHWVPAYDRRDDGTKKSDPLRRWNLVNGRFRVNDQYSGALTGNAFENNDVSDQIRWGTAMGSFFFLME